MAALPYMQLYVADYLADTMHLTTEEHGAYLLLIFNYWQTGKAIPKKRLDKIARVPNDRWPSVEDSLSEFFNDNGDEWVHERIEADLRAVEEAQAQRTKAGKASSEARKAAKRTKHKRETNESSTVVDDSLQREGNENPTNKEKIREEKIREVKTIGPSPSDEPTQPDQSVPETPARTARAEYPPEFDRVWQKYPQRPGSNPKRKALHAWNARLKEGYDPADILAGVVRYAAYCKQTGKGSTEYVMQAQRFLGPSCEFENPWTPPERLAPERNRHSGFGDIDYSQGIKREVPDGVANF